MKLIALVLILVAVCTRAQYTKYLFSAAQVTRFGARCLDGSPSGFYYRNATSNLTLRKWQIQLVGGGFCVPNATADSGCDDCYQRAKSSLGSSNYWKSSPQYTPPNFSITWNTIIVPYCGGDLHTGTRTDAYGGLYYAGHNTVAAVVQTLKEEFGLGKSGDELMLSGGSAGGIGTFINIDYVVAQLPSVTIRAFPNAGWFIAYPQYASSDHRNRSAAAQYMVQYAHSYVNQACLRALNLPLLCLQVDNNWKYVQQLKIPFFVANSMFDTNQLNALIINFNSYDYKDPNENEYLVNFGATLRKSALAEAAPDYNGIFLTATAVHGVPYTLTINGTSLQNTLTAWYNKTGNYQIIDKCTTPNCQVIPLPTR